MLEKIGSFINPIFAPLIKNTPLILTGGGVLLILIGAIWGNELDSWIKGSGNAVLSGGSAVLGAGVFSVIVTSAQFSDVFQKHVLDAIYSPGRVFEMDELKSKWSELTDQIFLKTLPRSHKDATKLVCDHIVDQENMYHFEKLRMEYTIDVESLSRPASILMTTSARLVVTPNCEDPVLTQDLQIEGELRLIALTLNDNPVDLEGPLTASNESDGRYEFAVHLGEYIQHDGLSGDRFVEMRRTYEATQDLSQEPYIAGLVTRFTKGLFVSYRITEGFKVTLTAIGPGKEWMFKSPKPFQDGYKYTCYSLADNSKLLMPGQGFMLVITADADKSGSMNAGELDDPGSGTNPVVESS